MKKRIKKIGIMILSFILFTHPVCASDYSVSLTSKSVTEGNDVTLTIDGTASAITGRFNVKSSDTSVASLSNSSIWIENNIGSITINANKAGTATITITPSEGMSDSDANEVTLQTKTITLTVNAKPAPVENNTPARTKSSNNYLSSITIDGLSLKEDFNKDALEYTAEAPVGTTEIKINAQLADSNASVTGTGSVKVTTGINKFEITVTAENGSKRTYKLTVTVDEEQPIKVTIDKKEYTMVKKRSELPKISDYNIEKDITIDDNIIEGYFNEKFNYNLIGLKDENGKINYYIYNKGKYTLYREFTFGATTLQIIDRKINNLKKTSFTYDGEEITAYQEYKLNILKNTYALEENTVSSKDFYLFYAKNLETGKDNIYQYDALEKTVQRYNLEVLNMYKSNLNTYYMYLLFSLILSVVLIVSILLIISNNKKNQFNKTRRKKLDLMRFEEE